MISTCVLKSLCEITSTPTPTLTSAIEISFPQVHNGCQIIRSSNDYPNQHPNFISLFTNLTITLTSQSPNLKPTYSPSPLP